MKQAGGGFAPSYNVQIDTDAANGVVVAVGVVQAGNDFEQLETGIERVEQNLEARLPKRWSPMEGLSAETISWR